MTIWQTVGRPGYFGRHRDERYQEYDRTYGAGNWRIVWQIGEYVGGIEAITALYEDAYFALFRVSPFLLRQLIREASDVYDDSPTNVVSGLSYAVQETNRTHLQDIAIRRCLVRCGVWFHGDALIRIRDSDGDHPLSLALSPGRVSMHCPEWLIRPALVGWWRPGSIEEFYQSNKLLQVRAD